MEHKKIQLFYKNLFKLASRGCGNKVLANPVVVFTRQAKDGVFETISDEEYYVLLNDVEEERKFWNEVPEQTVWELLQTSLENINLTPEKLDSIANIFGEAYENTGAGYMPLPLMTEKNLKINLFEQSVDRTAMEDSASSKQEQEKDTEMEDARLSRQGYGNYEPFVEFPDYICLYLDDFVYAQKEAKQAAAMMVWNHLHGRKQNMILAGPTGCGKTEIFRQLKKVYPNIVIYDANSLTAEGFKGNMKVRNLFDGVDKEQAERLIIVLDEADKLFESKPTSSGMDPGRIIQNELLKIIEGDMVHFEGDPDHPNNVPTLDLDTSKVSFVFLGSFERMLQAKNAEKKKNFGFLSDVSENEKMIDYHVDFSQEDLVQYANIRPEIAGRITEIVQLYPLTEEDYLKILSNPYSNPVKSMAEHYQKKLALSENTKAQLAKETVESKMGVRYIKSRLQAILDEQLFEDCEKEEYLL